MKRNRWLIALSAMGLHLCIGSVYAWSVLTKPIMESMGFTLKETTWTFSLAILFLGLSAGFLGSFVQKIGPRKSGLLSMTCFVTAMFGTAAALYAHSLPMLYAFYGVIGGIGLGTGYITPVSTLVKWFPENRGFATGLAIMGFGFASLIAGPAMQLLVQHFGLVANFIILGCVYMVIMTASSLYLASPAAGDVPAKAEKEGTVEYADAQPQFTVRQAMKTWQFYAIWWLFFTNITCGIALLSVASPMAQDVVGMSPLAAASMVGLIGLMNGAGRIAWATVSDYLGRSATYVLFFLIEILLSGSWPALPAPLASRSWSCSSSPAMAAASRACRPISATSSARNTSAPSTAVSSRPGGLPASPVPWSCRLSKKIPIATP